MRGVPETTRRIFLYRSASAEMITSKETSVRMGMTPPMSGTFASSMAIVAMLETRMVTTSSEGWSWPIWRLPISRRLAMMSA